MKKHIIGTALMTGLLLSGCGMDTATPSAPSSGATATPVSMSKPVTEQVAIPEALHTEQHEITSIENGNIHGENLSGTGEGIYYSVAYFESLGVTVEVGDVVEISWTEEQADNSEWETIYALKKL